MHKRIVSTAVLAVLATVAYGSDDNLLTEAKREYNAGQLQTAEVLCKQYLESGPAAADEAKARLLLGYTQAKKNSATDSALTTFVDLAAKFPNTAEAREALLRAGYLRDRKGEKPAEWEQVAAKYPDSREAAEALHCLGHVALRQNDPALAVKRFRDSSTAKGAGADMAEDSLVEAGYACISQFWRSWDHNLLAQATEIFAPVKDKFRSPASAVRAHMGLGELYLIRNMGKEAAEEYKAALILGPKSEYTHGVAQFELASAYYATCDWTNALASYDEFLSNRTGSNLVQKDASWRNARPGYANLAATNPAKAKRLSGLELVPAAAYFKAASLAHLDKHSEARTLALQVLDQFPELGIRARVERLIAVCDAALKEDK